MCKMKKFLVMLLAGVLAVGSLATCGDGATGGSDKKRMAMSLPVTIHRY